MQAIVKTGGQQFSVASGQLIKVEKLSQEQGETVVLDHVLMINDGAEVIVGTPTIAKASVTASVVRHARAKKINIIKFKRRKHHMKRMGHRQWFTELKIEAINQG